jgi:iron(III) transport system ATP-binding protein
VIRIGDSCVFSAADGLFVTPDRRRVGMVFQSYAIWPHLTVFDNVAYPLRGRRGRPKAEVRERTLEALELVGLRALADRPSPNLSGGQQQRVALARALVSRPQVLLLDEPLSNLDATLRVEMRRQIREIQQRLKITTLYVTHDQSEALAISDTVVVMANGKIVGQGTPQALYDAPGTRFVAEFLGAVNIIDLVERPAGVSGHPDVWRARTTLGELHFKRGPDDSVTDHSQLSVVARPEDVMVSVDRPSAVCNVWSGRIVSSLFQARYHEVVVDVEGGQRLVAHLSRRAAAEIQDPHVHVTIEPEALGLVSGPSARSRDEVGSARIA